MTDTITKLVELISHSAPWAIAGLAIGALVAYFQMVLIRKERLYRQKLDYEREKHMMMMLEVKDRRLDELHMEIKRLQDDLDKTRRTIR